MVRRFLATAALLVATSAPASAQDAALDVGGSWLTTWDGHEAQLELNQVVGDQVLGVYVGKPEQGKPTFVGSVAGVLEGRLLTGRWTDAGSTGGFRLHFSADGSTFQGSWGRTVQSVDDGGSWNGRKMGSEPE